MRCARRSVPTASGRPCCLVAVFLGLGLLAERALLAGHHRLPPAPDRDAARQRADAARRGRAPPRVRPRLDRLLRDRLARRLPAVRLAAAAARPDRAAAAGGDRDLADLGPAALRPGTGCGTVPHPADEHGLGPALARLADRGGRLVHLRPPAPRLPRRAGPRAAGADPAGGRPVPGLAGHPAARGVAAAGRRRRRHPTLDQRLDLDRPRAAVAARAAGCRAAVLHPARAGLPGGPGADHRSVGRAHPPPAGLGHGRGRTAADRRPARSRPARRHPDRRRAPARLAVGARLRPHGRRHDPVAAAPGRPARGGHPAGGRAALARAAQLDRPQPRAECHTGRRRDARGPVPTGTDPHPPADRAQRPVRGAVRDGGADGALGTGRRRSGR